MAKTTTWQPILADRLIPQATAAIRSIAVEVEKVGPTTPASCCEHALLFAYLAVAHSSDEWGEKAIGCLNTAIEQVCTSGDHWYLALFGGMAQVGWIVDHVTGLLAEVSNYPQEDSAAHEDDPIADIDSLILRRLEQDSWGGQYDLISGLVGFGVYYLERLPRKSAIRGIQLLLRKLEEWAESQPAGTTWFTPPELLVADQRNAYPEGYYNLGVAHGVPGVMQFLSEVIAAGIETQRSTNLLEGAVRWLLAQQRPPDRSSRFSSWVVSGLESEDSRLGWCYGDLGIAAILHHCATRIGRRDWHQIASGLFEHCFLLPSDKGRIRDAGMCHGALGVAHILNRIYHCDGDYRYKELANSWYERGLAMRTDGGVGGFSSYVPEKNPVWDPDPSFLGGAVGIALALISAIHPVEPEWDRVLLLSGRDYSRRSETQDRQNMVYS